MWATLPGCRRSPVPPLVVAAHLWPGYEFMFLAQREGLLNEQLVSLRETGSPSESMRALLEGSVDAAALTLDEVLRTRAQGGHLSVALVFDISAGADVVLARPSIRKLKDIKGKRIGVEEGALGALMLSELLKAAYLERADVEVVPLTIDQHEAAWQRGEVDVMVCYPPTSSRLLGAGAVNLFDSRQLPNTIVDVLAVRQEVLEQKRDAVRHLVAAHFHEVDHLQRNPQDASYRMSRHLNLPAEAVLAAYKGILLPESEQNHRLLGGEAPALLQSARILLHVMLDEKILTQTDTLDGLLRADFLPGEQK